MVNQGDQSTTPSSCAVFPDGGVILKWLEGVGWGESCFLNEGNQNCVFLEEVLELLEGILDAISVELEDVAGRGWEG